jgi:NAD(P)-dependent dehydrogenase (short-subunit alcohol dehydrogenase family)
MDAVITGASTGIGRAVALRLHAEGWRVFAGVRRPEDGDALQAAAGGDRLVPLIIDVTDADTVTRARYTVQDALGPGSGLHGLVNNAGIGIGGPVEFVPLDDWRRQLEVNVIAQVAVTQAFLPMVRQVKGRIVNVGSIGGRLAAPFVGPYGASKFAMDTCEYRTCSCEAASANELNRRPPPDRRRDRPGLDDRDPDPELAQLDAQ